MLIKWFTENKIDILDIVGEKCKEQRTDTEQNSTTPTESGEKEIALHCTAREFYLHQAISKKAKT